MRDHPIDCSAVGESDRRRPWTKPVVIESLARRSEQHVTVSTDYTTMHGGFTFQFGS
jgi:hypothetical protein